MSDNKNNDEATYTVEGNGEFIENLKNAFKKATDMTDAEALKISLNIWRNSTNSAAMQFLR